MWTRRELLVASALAGVGAASPATAMRLRTRGPRHRTLRIALLQSAAPFVDERDLRGSRARAFAALAVLLERSAAAHARLDALVAGAWPLAAAAPLQPAARAAFALDAGAAELEALRGFARRHGLTLLLGAWWRGRSARIEPRLLAVDADGTLAAQLLRAGAGAGPGEAFATACARLGLPGARVEPACDPATAPQVIAPRGGGTRLLAADGRAIVAATTQAETCIVGELPG